MNMNSNLSKNQKFFLIGFRIGYSEKDCPINQLTPFDYDIEETLIEVIKESRKDSRLLGILINWIGKHGDQIILDKFLKKLALQDDITIDDPILQFMIASALINGHRKWKKVFKIKPNNPLYPIDKDLLISSIKMKGKNEDYAKIGVIIPIGFLKSKESNAFSQEELSKINVQYRNRLIYGSNIRADVITAIECGLENPFIISKEIGCSYEPAYRIMKEYKIALQSVG